MTPRLHELAAKYGVSTHYDRPLVVIDGEDVWLAQDGEREPRPDLEIAHELLAKLPNDDDRNFFMLMYNKDGRWHLTTADIFADHDYTDFVLAVIALAERQEGI